MFIIFVFVSNLFGVTEPEASFSYRAAPSQDAVETAHTAASCFNECGPLKNLKDKSHFAGCILGCADIFYPTTVGEIKDCTPDRPETFLTFGHCPRDIERSAKKNCGNGITLAEPMTCDGTGSSCTQCDPGDVLPAES